MVESPHVSQLDGYYVWESPGNSLKVLLNLRMVDFLKKAFHEASQSSQEIGGFLLGRWEHAGPRKFITTIDDFEVVESDRQRDQHYDLNERDRKRFARRLSRSLSEREPRLTPVGYFRTHQRPDLFLAAGDLALMRAHFTDPAAVALLIQPEPASMAGFFCWDCGDLRTEAVPKFPFNAGRLAQGNFTILQSLEMKPGEASSAIRMSSNSSSRVRPWSWAAAAASVVALALLGWYGAQSPPSEAQQPPAFGLEVHPAGKELRLSWNPKSAEIEGADRAILWVSDGGVRKRMDLNQQQIAAGYTLYAPVAGDIDFRLSVFHRDRERDESIRGLTEVAKAASLPAPESGSADRSVESASSAVEKSSSPKTRWKFKSKRGRRATARKRPATAALPRP